MLAALAKMLGLSQEHAEASMHSDRAARHVLSRRSAIGVGAALAGGSLFSFLNPYAGYEIWDIATQGRRIHALSLTRPLIVRGSGYFVMTDCLVDISRTDHTGPAVDCSSQWKASTLETSGFLNALGLPSVLIQNVHAIGNGKSRGFLLR